MSESRDNLLEGSLSPAAKLKLVFAWAVIIAVFSAALFERSQLIDHLPIQVSLLGAVAGFGVGAWLSWRIFKRQVRKLRLRAQLALIVIPIVLILLGTYGARAIYEIVQFADTDITRTKVRASVVDIYTPRLPFGFREAEVVFGDGSRKIDILVEDGLYHRLEPFRFPGRDCLILTVETNSVGTGRVLFPNHFDPPLGQDAYQQC